MKPLLVALLLYVGLVSVTPSAFAQDRTLFVPIPERGGPSAVVYWATVAADGSIISYTPGVTSAFGFGTGRYEIIFEVDDITKCFATGTQANPRQHSPLSGHIGIVGRSSDPTNG